MKPGIFNQCVAGLLIIGLSACATLPDTQLPDAADGSDSLAQTYVKLGLEYMKQGQRALALSKLQRAIQLDPRLPSAHNALAILYEQLKDTKLAGEHYRQAVQYGPKDSLARNNYGTFLCKQNEPQKGEQELLLALNDPLYPTPELAYENLGLCALRLSDPAKAEQYFRKALEINARLPGALYQMALLNSSTQNYLSARAYLQRYSEVARHTPQSLWLGIKVERELGDKNAVSSYSLLLKSNFPDSDETKLLVNSEAVGTDS